MEGTGLIIVVAVVAILIMALIAFITRQYHRVPPSQVMVVYGRKDARMVSNGGVFVLPVIETYKMLDITIMTIKQEKDEVYTVSGVPIRLDWVAQVQIDPEESMLRTAARAFLDKSREDIRVILLETLSANFRAIVGQMTVEGIHRDRDAFIQKVQDLARDDVAAMGVRIIAMGIEEISDDQGYLIAMAAPQIAAVKRDATIAEAEAQREARVKAATATREGEQAELDAQRQILQQREALSIREVEVEKTVGLARAASEQEVQKQRALAVEQQQEAEVLVPARARGQSVEIEAEAARRKLTINAAAEAEAVRARAEAEARATEQRGRAEAVARQALQEADAAGEKAKLLAEAEGRRELAAASAAENEINLRQFLIEQILQADVAKVQAMAEAMGGLGGNVRIVQFGNGNGNGHENGGSNNALLNMLMQMPEVSEMFKTKVEALSGEDFESTVERVAHLFSVLRGADASPVSSTVSAMTAPLPPSSPAPTNGAPLKPDADAPPAALME